MNEEIKKASFLNITINVFLMILNLAIGILTSTLSFISKGIESLQDVVTAIIIHFTIKINNKEADEDHQFGHSRAENIAGYTIGVIMIIVSLEIIYSAILKLQNPVPIEYNHILFITLIIALGSKLFLFFYTKNILKRHNSPALKANIQDHFNDILMYIGLFIAVIGIKLGYPIVDSIIAMVIGIIILRSGFEIASENVTFLMGIRADKKTIQKIEKTTNSFKEVKNIDLIRTQYLGNKVQVEIHVAINKDLKLEKSHEIEEDIKEEIEKIQEVINCFVHINPYKNNSNK